MRHAARVQVVVAEPIRNLSTSAVPWLAKLAQRHTNPGLGTQPRRFTEATLDEFFHALETPPSRSFLIPGGREKVHVLDAARESAEGAGADHPAASPDAQGKAGPGTTATAVFAK